MTEDGTWHIWVDTGEPLPIVSLETLMAGLNDSKR